ncbi:MAG: aminodeoxychorismate lyase [Gammaproteobacteria bacterium]
MMGMLVNGVPGTSIDANDRGLHYGDGLFETIAVRDGAPALWDRHMQRLLLGCERLGIAPIDAAQLLRESLQLCDGVAEGVLKIIITRGSGGRGYRAPPSTHRDVLVSQETGGRERPGAVQPTRLVALYAWPEYPSAFWIEGVPVRLCSIRMGSNTALAGIKHLNRLEQVLARSEWDDSAIPEGLMLDGEGHVIEGTMSNFFIVRNGRLLTPDLKRCGVAGVMRGCILDGARDAGIPVDITQITLDDVKSSDEAFLCNSLIGVWPVRHCAGIDFPAHRPITGYIAAMIRERELQK